MATANLNDFRAQFPEFSETEDDKVNFALSLAKQFNNKSKRLILYAAAHLLAGKYIEPSSPGMDGGAGELMKYALGPKAQEFKTMADDGSEVFFTTTSYGRIFLTLEKRNLNTTLGGIKVYG